MWGSERKPDWLEMFSSFSELKLFSITWVKYLQFLESDSYCLTKKLIRKCLSGLYAPADKTRIVLTKLKDKLCHDKCFTRFLHPLKKFGAVKFRQRLICSWDSRHSVPMYWEFCAPTPPIKKIFALKNKQTNKNKQKQIKQTKKRTKTKQCIFDLLRSCDRKFVFNNLN